MVGIIFLPFWYYSSSSLLCCEIKDWAGSNPRTHSWFLENKRLRNRCGLSPVTSHPVAAVQLPSRKQVKSPQWRNKFNIRMTPKLPAITGSCPTGTEPTPRVSPTPWTIWMYFLSSVIFFNSSLRWKPYKSKLSHHQILFEKQLALELTQLLRRYQQQTKRPYCHPYGIR